MSLLTYITQHSGNVVDWPPDGPPPDPAEVIYRVRLSYDEEDDGRLWTDKFAEMLEQVDTTRMTDFIIGAWTIDFNATAAAAIEALVMARDRFPKLRGLFVGDMSSEECEISWIEQGDVSPILNAFPNLEHLCTRGGNNLTFGKLRHAHLKALIVQSGGLPAGVVREVAAADLPALEHLELWLGTPDYGGNATLDDLTPIFSGNVFPNLKYLGLRDSEMADDIAAAIVHAPILDRIDTLDLSMGTLSDRGALALVNSPKVARLRRLNISHNYCTPAVLAKFEFLDAQVVARDSMGPDEEWRYVEVGE